MSIKAFAALRSVLRHAESKIPDEAVTLANIGAWHTKLRDAVQKCYDQPLEGLPAFDADGVARVSVRVSEATAAADFPREQAVRRAIIAELVAPALKQAGSADKKAVDRAFKGLRTVVEAACSGFVRYYCDRADAENGEEGALFKLRAVRDALEGSDLQLAVARVETLLDPTFTLHLGIAEVEEPQRVPSHDGVARFHQRAPHDRPFVVQRLVVTFSAPPAAPPAIQAVFVNEALVDAFWDWTAPAVGEEPTALTQTIKLAKAQTSVRSWSAVVANDTVTLIAPEVDNSSETIVNRTPSGSMRVVVKPGRLVATPLLRDVILSTLRHFHGTVNQEKVIFSVLQHRMEARADVLVGALPNAAQPAKFHHADADVSIVIPSTGVARHRVGWSYLTRLFVLLGVAAVVARRFLRGMKFGVALSALVLACTRGITKSAAFRRLVLGSVVPHNKRVNILAVAIARATGNSTSAPSIRNSLVAALTAHSIPFAEVSAAEVEAALQTVARVAAATSSATAVNEQYKALSFVEGAPAVAAVLSVASGLRTSAAVVAAVGAGGKASAEQAVDVILRQAQFIADDTALLNIAAATSDGQLPVAWPRIAGRAGATDVSIFAVDRTAVITALPADQAKFLASVATNLL